MELHIIMFLNAIYSWVARAALIYAEDAKPHLREQAYESCRELLLRNPHLINSSIRALELMEESALVNANAADFQHYYSLMSGGEGKPEKKNMGEQWRLLAEKTAIRLVKLELDEAV